MVGEACPPQPTAQKIRPSIISVLIETPTFRGRNKEVKDCRPKQRSALVAGGVPGQIVVRRRQLLGGGGSADLLAQVVFETFETPVSVVAEIFEQNLERVLDVGQRLGVAGAGSGESDLDAALFAAKSRRCSSGMAAFGGLDGSDHLGPGFERVGVLAGDGVSGIVAGQGQ